MSFLPDGRTHADIDQPFIGTTKRLRSENAVTLADLHNLKRAYGGRVCAVPMKLILRRSRVCSQERALQRMPPFSHLLLFITINCSATPIRSELYVLCSVAAGYCDVSVSLLTGSNANDKNAFFIFTSDLRNISLTISYYLSGKGEMMEKLHSQEQSINDAAKMRSLYDVRVYSYGDQQSWISKHHTEMQTFKWKCNRAKY